MFSLKRPTIIDRFGVLLILAATLPSMVVGVVAYNVMYEHIRSDRIRDVGQISESKHAQLALLLKRQADELETRLGEMDMSCGKADPREQQACFSSKLHSLMMADDMLGAILFRGEERIALAGEASVDAGQLSFQPQQLAKFSGTGPDRNQSYFVAVDRQSSGLRLAGVYSSATLQQLFFPPPEELGASGETFLADGEGYFVTRARYPSVQGRENAHPITARPMRACLNRENREVLDLDYRDADIIHGFRFVPEFGAACIMAHIEQHEAFAPLGEFKQKFAAFMLILLLPVMLFARFVSKRIRKANELQQRDHVLLHNSMDGVHILNMDGDIIEVNESFCRMLGYSMEEALRLNVADLDSQWTREELRERFSQLVGKDAMFETTHRRKDGSVIPVEICSSNVEVNGERIFFATSRDISERKRLEKVLLTHTQVLDTAMDGYWLVDEHGHLLEANEAYADMSGYSVDELKGMHIMQLEAKETLDDIREHIARIITQGHDNFETRHRRKDGSVFEVEISASFMPEARQFSVFSHDISERKQAEEALRVSAVTFETHDGIVITDVQANIVRVNRAFTDITGYSEEEVLGKNPRIMSSGRQDKAFYTEMWQQLLHTGSWSGEIWDRRKSGQIYPKWMNITAVKNDRKETTHYVAIFSDITARKQAEDEIRNLAFYDALTRLPNRRLFLDRFRAALTISARRNDYGAVFFIDLDRFKLLNDTMGHDYGDLLLIEVAERTKSCVREMDTVARLGGDEFVVLIEGVGDELDEASRRAGAVAEKIRETLARPYRLKSHEHHSSPSMGISLFHGNKISVDELMQQADMAMYQAKNAGRNAVRFFDPVMQQNVTMRALLENDLRHAIALGQMQLHYQVQVDNRRRPLGAEVLLRWHHPERGLVMPGQFIPIAEESSLILEIGDWVLEQACIQLGRWRNSERTKDLVLAVNVSAKQFSQPNFVEKIAAMLDAHNVEPRCLKLELTESLVLHDLKSTINKMHALKQLGVGLSMDDFGTGYSSLSYLKDLPLDQIKIDQNFIHGISGGGNDALLVRTIINLAENFRMEVIAEGVEDEAQLDFLARHACPAYQGYFFGQAVALEEFEVMLDGMKTDGDS